MDSGAEIFSMLGSPARAIGRIPLIFRFLGQGSAVMSSATSRYATERFGANHRMRPWLHFDYAELEMIEHLINGGGDEDVFAYRRMQLASGATTTVVGSLLASVCATMLTLDSVSDVNLIVRGLFTVSLMLSLTAVYFALVQQRALALPTSAETLRIWLWNGRTRKVNNTDGNTGRRTVRESSLASNIIVQAPFELLSISISLFLAALAAYLGLAMVQNVKLGTGPWPGNTAYFIFFLVCTVFTLAMFGQALGEKDREILKCRVVNTPT